MLEKNPNFQEGNEMLIPTQKESQPLLENAKACPDVLHLIPCPADFEIVTENQKSYMTQYESTCFTCPALLIIPLIVAPLLPKSSVLVTGNLLVNMTNNNTSNGGDFELTGSYEADNDHNSTFLFADPYSDSNDIAHSKKWIVGRNLNKLYFALLPFKARVNGDCYVPSTSVKIAVSDWGGDQFFGGNPDMSALLLNLAATKIRDNHSIESVTLTFHNSSLQPNGKYENLCKLLSKNEVSSVYIYRQMMGNLPTKLKTSDQATKKDEIQTTIEIFDGLFSRFKDWKKEMKKVKEAKEKENKKQQKIMLQKQKEKEKIIKKNNYK